MPCCLQHKTQNITIAPMSIILLPALIGICINDCCCPYMVQHIAIIASREK